MAIPHFLLIRVPSGPQVDSHKARLKLADLNIGRDGHTAAGKIPVRTRYQLDIVDVDPGLVQKADMSIAIRLSYDLVFVRNPEIGLQAIRELSDVIERTYFHEGNQLGIQ